MDEPRYCMQTLDFLTSAKQSKQISEQLEEEKNDDSSIKQQAQTIIELQNKVQQNLQTINKLQDQINEWEKTCSKLSKDKNQLEMKLSTKEITISTKQIELFEKSARDEIEILQNKQTNLECENKNLGAENESLRWDIKTTQNYIEEYKTSIDLHLTEIQKILAETHIIIYDSENDEEKNSLDKLPQLSDDVKYVVGELQSGINELLQFIQKQTGRSPVDVVKENRLKLQSAENDSNEDSKITKIQVPIANVVHLLKETKSLESNIEQLENNQDLKKRISKANYELIIVHTLLESKLSALQKNDETTLNEDNDDLIQYFDGLF